MSWWKSAVVYQVYPRSFQDSDADGVGDLRGIVARADHFASLGVDAVWLSPIFASPGADMGYDVSDHCAIDPLFGTLADFDALVAALHNRGVKLLLDFVPNHTSIEHPWFREHPDWYVWRDRPNNWLSNFGGSAWTLDPGRGKYYLHTFLEEQPDLDWRNPQVVEAMLGVLRFWLARGADGFRVDALEYVIKDAALRDNPPNPDFVAGRDRAHRALRAVHSKNQPEAHAVAAAMRRVMDEFGALFVGELYLPPEELAAWYAECHLPFNFSLVWPQPPWRADEIAAIVRRVEASLPPGAWPAWVLGNHDVSRIASRVGAAQARVAATLLLTLRGTPTLYQGDELGLTDVPIPKESLRDGRAFTEPELGRDPERTPMAWTSDAPAAGFTTGRPWLPLHGDCAVRNVAKQSADPDSMLSLHRRLLALRRREPALSVGAIEKVGADGSVLRYDRVAADGRRLRVLLNLSASPARVDARGTIVFSTAVARENTRLDGLGGDEAVIVSPW